MTILLFTNINKFLQTHEGFNLNMLHTICEDNGWYAFVRPTDDVYYDKKLYPRFYFSTIKPDYDLLRVQIDEVLSLVKPTKVVNLLEKFFPWNLVNTTAEKIYFVRSCARKLSQEIKKHADDSIIYDRANNLYEELAKREEYFISLSDRIITDSPTSAAAIKEVYGIDNIPIGWEYINPTKYNTMTRPADFVPVVYNIGRTDFQKGLQYVREPKKIWFISIGGAAVGEDNIRGKATEINGLFSYEEYAPIIKDCNYGLFPSFWESNGYAVQECLAMGKIPIIQKDSGGNERLCNLDNSFVIDFPTTDWEEIIFDNMKMQEMSAAARDTLTYDMYKESLDRFIDDIVK